MVSPTLIWSCIRGSGNSSSEDVDDCIRIWNERKQLLLERGIDLKLLVPKKSLRREGIFPVVDFFEREHPDFLLEAFGVREKDKEEQYDQRLAWPRDSFQIFGKTMFCPGSDYLHVQRIRGDLNLENLGLEISSIGEGGLNVGTDKFRIFSDVCKIRQDDISLVEREGYAIYRMPILGFIPFEGFAKRLAMRMSVNGHIDTELNCTETPGGNVLLAVNEEYHNIFKKEMEALRKSLDAKIYVVRGSEVSGRAVNFISLPDKSVLLPRKEIISSGGLAKFLEDNIGKRNVHSLETFRHEYSCADGGGGLRCRTNLVYTNNLAIHST